MGDVITRDSVRSVRPGFGLAPKYFESILGMRVKTDVSSNSAVKMELLTEE